MKVTEQKINTKLVYDLEITGHHLEYLTHLIRYVDQKPMNMTRYVFIVNPRFKKVFEKVELIGTNSNKIEIVCVSEKEYVSSRMGNIFVQSIHNYRIMNKYARFFEANSVCLLNFNIFHLSLSIFRPNYKLSGILFHQFYKSEKSNIKKKMKYYRKFLQTWLVAKNRKIESIFILNDLETVEYFNKTYKTMIFRVLSDPIEKNIKDAKIIIREKYKIGERAIFLLFGNPSERKGTYEILESLKMLEKGSASKIAIIIVGSATKEDDERIKASVKEVTKKVSTIKIVYINKYVTVEEMNSYFSQTDYVLVLYKNPEASSGIIGHAAIHYKPVIGPTKGLLSQIIRRYGLGITVDVGNLEEIAKSFSEHSRIKIDREGAKEYVDTCSVEDFTKKLLDA